MTKSRYYIHGSDNFRIRTYHLYILKAQYHVGDIIRIGRYEHKNYMYGTYRILNLYSICDVGRVYINSYTRIIQLF